MKKGLIWVMIMFFSLLVSCGSFETVQYEKKPEDTNLEFWITEDVTNFKFDNYQEKYGMFGGKEYYGTGYVPSIGEDNMQIDPERVVIYTVTAYPDYASDKRSITNIKITDPDIHFYNLNLYSSHQEIIDTLKAYGYNKEEESDNYLKMTKSKINIVFSNSMIKISVEVTNNQGIMF